MRQSTCIPPLLLAALLTALVVTAARAWAPSIVHAAAHTVATDAPQATPQASPVVYTADTGERRSWARDAAGVTRMHNGLPRGAKATTAPLRADPDPLQRHCRAMLDSSLGRQPKWKLAAARYCVATGQTADKTAWVTTYCDRCDRSGICADGTPLRDGVCAANPEVPLHRIVWTQAFGFSVVADRGTHVKLRYAHGRRVNVDTYMQRGCPGGCSAGKGQKPKSIGAVIGDVQTVCGTKAAQIGAK